MTGFASKAKGKELKLRRDAMNRPTTPDKRAKQLKTPTKLTTSDLSGSGISQKGRSETMKRPNQRTPSTYKQKCD